mgnify:CR=1 FL=1
MQPECLLTARPGSYGSQWQTAPGLGRRARHIMTIMLTKFQNEMSCFKPFRASTLNLTDNSGCILARGNLRVTPTAVRDAAAGSSRSLLRPGGGGAAQRRRKFKSLTRVPFRLSLFQ